MKAIITGSFDPITIGHIEIIKKASSFFDELYVVALVNSEKEYMFSLEEKREIMELSLADFKNVKIDAYDGLTADYMHKHGITKIIRGIRDKHDEEYENKLAKAMASFDSDFETIFIHSDEKYKKISSTTVRKAITENKKLIGMIDERAIKRVKEIYNAKK
jgi:pantetheine-phosphate adenylyltransferase